MHEKKCKNGCCTLFCRDNAEGIYKSSIRYGKKRRKGGIVFHDLNKDKILIVQSYGEKWGFPKGSLEDVDKDIEECAIREAFEETGIKLSKEDFQSSFKCYNSVYFYTVYNEKLIYVKDIPDLTITGIGWINRECARQFMDHLNYHSKQLIGWLDRKLKSTSPPASPKSIATQGEIIVKS